MLKQRSEMIPDDMDEAIDEVSEIKEDSPTTTFKNSVSESSKLGGTIITPVPVD